MKRVIFRLARLLWITPRLIANWLTIRKPSPHFDSKFYAESNPHISSKPSLQRLHYILVGENRGFSPNRFFDPDYYANANGLGKQTNGASFAHYLKKGAAEQTRIGKLYDPAWYAKRYGSDPESGGHAMRHYERAGVFLRHYPCAEVEALVNKPTVSIITPIYNTDTYFLKRCVESVLFQAYPHWELCLVDDGSTRSGLHAELQRYTELDERIKLQTLEQNGGISKASSEGLKIATGEYISFLDHDDELACDALYACVREINRRDPDIMYSDEQLVSETNRKLGTMYKPDLNPALLLNHNYITHFVMMRTSLLEQTTPFPRGSDGAQDHDLLLKLTELTDKVRHIPRSLYNWRTSQTSTSANADQKPYAIESSQRVVKNALKRRDIDAKVEAGKANFYHDIVPHVQGEPGIDIIVTPSLNTLNKYDELEQLIAHCSGQKASLHFMLSEQIDITAEQGRLFEKNNITVHNPRSGHGLMATANRVALDSTAELVAFIGQDVIPRDAGWISTFAGYAQLDGAGLVGGNSLGKCLTPEHKINFSCPNPAYKEAVYYKNFLLHGSRCLSGQECTQNTTYISSAFCMIKRETFQAASGFDCTRYPELMYDLDLSLKLNVGGYTHTYVSFCSSSTAYDHVKPERDAYMAEKQRFQSTWQEVLTSGDPNHSLPYLLQCTSLTHAEWLAWYS